MEGGLVWTALVGLKPWRALCCSSEVSVWISGGLDTQNTTWHSGFILVQAFEPCVQQCIVLRVRNVQLRVLMMEESREIGRGLRGCYPIALGWFSWSVSCSSNRVHLPLFYVGLIFLALVDQSRSPFYMYPCLPLYTEEGIGVQVGGFI